MSRFAVGAPSFSATRSTSSSLGGSGSSSPGASASSGIPGPVPAIVSLIGSSFGPVLIFSRRRPSTASFAVELERAAADCSRPLLRGRRGSPYTSHDSLSPHSSASRHCRFSASHRSAVRRARKVGRGARSGDGRRQGAVPRRPARSGRGRSRSRRAVRPWRRRDGDAAVEAARRHGPRAGRGRQAREARQPCAARWLYRRRDRGGRRRGARRNPKPRR